MSMTEEAADFGLHQRAREVLGEQEGDRLMSRLLPVAWYDVAAKQDVAALQRDIEALRVATKQDVDALRLEVKQDLAEVKQDLAEVKQDLAGVKQDLAGVKQDLAALGKGLDAVGAGIDGRFEQLTHQLEGRMDRAFTRQTMWLLTLFVAMTAVVGLFGAIAL
jgi:septal ring factor EnvC (AmiA/AmiB activator)